MPAGRSWQANPVAQPRLSSCNSDRLRSPVRRRTPPRPDNHVLKAPSPKDEASVVRLPRQELFRGLGPASPTSCHLEYCSNPFTSRGDDREVHPESCSTQRLTLYLNITLVAFHDAVNY